MAESLPESTVALVEQRSGHLEIIGETAAKLILFQQGWNPYSRFLDQDKVDLILRRKRNGVPVYREVQVKYRRLFAKKENTRQWDARLFTAVAWYNVESDEFVENRPGLFVMFIFGYADRQLEKDVLIFPSRDFHDLIQRAPVTAKNKRVLYISKSRADNSWHVWLSRRKFFAIDASTCVDITRYRNNFAIID